jgi:uncharacterized Fe-S center protein
MPSTVYFATAETEKTRKSMVEQMGRLFDAADGRKLVAEGDLVALKLSFSEVGNTAHLRPPLVRQVVRRVRDCGGKPFLTDANTLYVGGRANAVDHLTTAVLNGFSYPVVEAPVIIADGLRGKSYETVQIDQKHCKTARIGAEIYHADGLISLAHVHGHGGTGLAATFKNIGMGLGARAGKQEMHSQKNPPKVNRDKCVGCGECVRYCPVEAIHLEDRKAVIDGDTCIRCGECTVTCPQRAIAIRWGDAPGQMQERIVEYTYAVLKDKPNKCLFYAVLLDVIPHCLCMGRSERPFIPDVGILCSTDPVAVEQATYDLVNAQQAIPASILGGAHGEGQNKYAALYPNEDSEITLRYAEQIGLGSRRYKLRDV